VASNISQTLAVGGRGVPKLPRRLTKDAVMEVIEVGGDGLCFFFCPNSLCFIPQTQPNMLWLCPLMPNHAQLFPIMPTSFQKNAQVKCQRLPKKFRV
jgi:hypothetical protein